MRLDPLPFQDPRSICLLCFEAIPSIPLLFSYSAMSAFHGPISYAIGVGQFLQYCI